MAPEDTRGRGAESDDAALAERVARGDEAAFRTLYERFAAIVHAIARRVLSDPQAAEECVQDVFVQVWRQAERFDPARGTLGAWIVTIARSRAFEHGRRLARRDIPSDDVSPAGAAGDHAGEVLAADDALVLARAMAELPVPQLEALRLAYFEGLSHSEIAGRLGVPLGTIKGRIRLALDRLRSDAGADLGSEEAT
jgi:RNA polymerase sigma-70 factor (ECF subfamily)